MKKREKGEEKRPKKRNGLRRSIRKRKENPYELRLAAGGRGSVQEAEGKRKFQNKFPEEGKKKKEPWQ